MTRLTSRGVTIGYRSGRQVNGKEVILDAQQRTAGYVSSDGTWDLSWRRIADFASPGLLLETSYEDQAGW